MKAHFSSFGLIACVLAQGSTLADEIAGNLEVEALSALISVPSFEDAEGFPREEGMRAVYFDALPWHGRPTKVFAWIGIPESAGDKLPGIVLVHGGGGTAFREWVKKWNNEGFAAISIAVEGQTDERDTGLKDQSNPQGWKKHDWAGPSRVGIYGDSGKPLKSQWMYHAIADTILANSLLRSLPEVDPGKVGVMGISWGGVITSTVIGIDERFAFAIPTYGCGHLFDAGNAYGRTLGNNTLYKTVWDPMVRLHKATMPTLWLSWPGDQHFPLDCLAACANATLGESSFSLIPRMKHSHPAGWNPPDSYAFARSVVDDGKSWFRVDSTELHDGVASVELHSFKPLDEAVLVSTSDKGFTGKRTWTERPATLEAISPNCWKMTAPIPDGTTAWFINARSGSLTASSGFHEEDKTP
ncbi:prolyl oligopeptidase family serine peptidase [Puniceicoccales bacterium CK1056]|uniref:Prolyl oligopeptidase family serine peptidase n=1 Tax=Oceanipulchritudo coccoides TaxID=2706888 RepID=A0A6B2M123_9BACT|nr:acetylxylan esterase [Oceanipulchritudo coccoides]NDV62066.1 prolyl oligopeptidase family serine peptidase [Oceanipulchritudo coccoides]